MSVISENRVPIRRNPSKGWGMGEGLPLTVSRAVVGGMERKRARVVKTTKSLKSMVWRRSGDNGMRRRRRRRITRTRTRNGVVFREGGWGEGMNENLTMAIWGPDTIR